MYPSHACPPVACMVLAVDLARASVVETTRTMATRLAMLQRSIRLLHGARGGIGAGDVGCSLAGVRSDGGGKLLALFEHRFAARAT